jgi:hypothetical protein
MGEALRLETSLIPLSFPGKVTFEREGHLDRIERLAE